MPLISVVTPVYKAEGCLEELYRRLVAALETITADFEIVMVEDSGGDCSWDIIRQLAASDPRVKGLQFSRNFGQHYGITAGLDVAEGDWVVVMDCDLQDRPEEIPALYAKALEGYDVVLARRGDHAGAAAALNEAAQLQPMNGLAWYALGMAWYHCNAPEKVEQVIEHTLTHDPQTAHRLIRDTGRTDLAHLLP
jgi:glycosyltransferase involved in cell wall biosynthesis